MTASRDRLATVVAVAVALVALWMWLHQLGLPYPRDYDEGVYWESLRAMDGGARLYRDVYSSQPPLFLISAFPIFEAFGRSLFAARLSCVVFSFVGLGGACLMGRAIAGHAGAAVAMVLAVSSIAYLQMSQTLQSEASALGLSWLAVGIAFAARPLPVAGRSALSALAGVIVAAALACKLLVIATLVPLFFAFAMEASGRDLRASLVAVAACFAGVLVATAAIVLAFAQDLPALWREVVLLHAAAPGGAFSSLAANAPLLAAPLASYLTLLAVAGAVVGFRCRNRNVAVLGAWFVATLIVLALLAPLFPHHLVALVPPSVSLALLTIAPGRDGVRRDEWLFERPGIAFITILVILTGITANTYYVRAARLASVPENVAMGDAVAAIDRLVPSDRRLVTDGQFVAALSNRDTPPSLVDTSFARVASGQLTTADALAAALAPDSGAVLLWARRLGSLPGFRSSLRAHFNLARDFGDGRELWLRSTLR